MVLTPIIQLSYSSHTLLFTDINVTTFHTTLYPIFHTNTNDVFNEHKDIELSR